MRKSRESQVKFLVGEFVRKRLVDALSPVGEIIKRTRFGEQTRYTMSGQGST